jgi:hypothetical protein
MVEEGCSADCERAECGLAKLLPIQPDTVPVVAHLVFIDESGCDKGIGFRRTGWSPLDVAPVQVAKFHRDRLYHILPAYTQDGVLFSQVFQGSTDSAVFEDYVEQLLPHYGRWPEPKSVLVMDNASFHHTERLE